MDQANSEYLTSQAVRVSCPSKRYQRIWTCLSREIESSSFPHPATGAIYEISGEGVTWLDRMAAVRYSGGMSDDFRPGGVSYATRRKGDVCLSKREGATWQFLGRIPQCPLLYRLSGLVRKCGIKMLPLQNLACGASSLWELVKCAWDLKAMPPFVNRL